MLRGLVSADSLPHVRAALDAGVFSPETEGDPFAFGRALVMDGMAAMIEGRATPPARADPDPFAEVVARDEKVKAAVKARREAEKHLREARKRERELERAARERARKQGR